MNKAPSTDNHQIRGIFLLPNLITTAGLLAGFFAMVVASQGQFTHAAIAIVIAACLDGLDGRVARLTNTTSAFGAQFDSMADFASFGIAPAWLAVAWTEHHFTQNIWILGFLFVVCAALRLARFNVQISSPLNRGFFQGMPSPSAAGTLVTFIWSAEIMQWHESSTTVWGIFALLVILGIMMVSNMRFYSFKDFNNKVPFIALLGVAVIIMLIASHTSIVLLIMGMLYLSSGPILTLLRLRSKRLEKKLRFYKNKT